MNQRLDMFDKVDFIIKNCLNLKLEDGQTIDSTKTFEYYNMDHVIGYEFWVWCIGCINREFKLTDFMGMNEQTGKYEFLWIDNTIDEFIDKFYSDYDCQYSDDIGIITIDPL